MHQFYSDYSSGEEEDYYEVWNPNELIDQIANTQNAEQKAALRKTLLEKFLDQQRPILTPKMKDYLVQDGVIESLMSFVTRVEAPTDSNSNGPAKKLVRVRSLDTSDEDPVRRSFNVMGVFMNPMNDLDSVLDDKLLHILRSLFGIFHANSRGNFLHFHKILDQLLIRAPVETTSLLLSQGFFWTLLDNLHEPGVVDTVIDVFCCGFPKQSDTINFYKSLVDAKVFEKIGEKIFGKGQVGCGAAGDFFVKLLEKLASHEMSGILFISLCRNSNFIDGLFKTITKNDDGSFTLEQQKASAAVLRELLLKSGEKMFEQADFTRPLPNMLSAVHDKLHDYAKPHVTGLCNVLIAADTGKASTKDLKLSAYTVRRPFGMYRFALVEILADIVCACPDTLDNMPPLIWSVLSRWFLDYSHNNLYQCQFFKLFQTVIRQNHLESQKQLLNRYKFLTKIIDHYATTQITDARGFILMILNTVRLAADLQSVQGTLRHFLSSHDQYKAFLPTLRNDTQIQLKRYSDLVLGMMDDDEDEEEELNIDLGSAYAHSLGFEEDPPASAPGVSSPANNKKKKNKKKKKKTKNGTSSPAPAGSPTVPHTQTKAPATTKPAPKPQPQEQQQQQQPQSNGSSSTPDWWSSLKNDFDKAEEEKKEKETQNPENSSTLDWWADLKKGLTEEHQHQVEKLSQQQHSHKQEETSFNAAWWNDMKGSLNTTDPATN